MSSRKPPPIPRKTETVPANIQRAREQIANKRNRERANAMVEKARQNRERRQVLTSGQQQSVETAFQQRNEMDAIVKDQLRQNSRREMANFQNRTGRILSSDVATRRRQIENARTQAQELTRELFLTAIAKRKFGGGLPELDPSSEKEVKQYLVNKFGSEANARAQVDKFGSQLGELPLPKKPPSTIGTTVRPTSSTPQPQPEPEPEPQPQPIPEPEPQLDRPRGGDSGGAIHTSVRGLKTGGEYADAGRDDALLTGTITKDEFSRRYGIGS